MQDYQIINIRKDGIKPDAFHGDYHIHLLGKAGRMDFMLGNKNISAQEGDLLVWQMSTDFTDIRYSDDFDAEMLLISSPFLALYNPDFRAFRLRIGTSMKLFNEEIVGEMLRIFLYDLWNVYSDEIERASDWIETYTSHELVKLLSDTRLTLTDVTDRMHFSSQAMLTRYMKRTVGKTPTEYRKQIIKH